MQKRLALLPVLFLLVGASGDDARSVVRTAARAVEGDSVRRVAARWEQRLRRNPGDRSAELGLATLARLTYGYTAADRHYERVLAASTGRAARDQLATYARLGQAQVLEIRRQLGAADSLYAQAEADARAASDSAAWAFALLSRYAVRVSTAGAAKASPLVDSAGRLVPPDAAELVAYYHCVRASALFATGRIADVAAEVDSGVTAARRAGAPTIEGRCLNQAARAARARGQLDSARTILGRAAAVQQRVHDRQGLARTLLFAAQVSMLQGRFGEAKDVLGRALATATEAGDSAAVGSAHLGLADVALSVNDHSAAAANLAWAIPRFEAQGDRDRATVARVWKAQLAASLGDFATAREQTLEVLRWYEQTGNAEGQGVQYRALAQYATRTGDWPAADRALADAHALAQRHGLHLLDQKLVYDRGRLALARGDLPAAKDAFAEYLGSLAADAYVQRYEVQMRLAEVYARQHSLTRAEGEMRAATAALDEWRGTLNDAQLRVFAFQAASTEASDVQTSVAAVIAALADDGRAAAAFELAERRRARELGDRLVRAEALATSGEAGPSPNARARWQSYDAPAADIASLIPDDSTALVEYVVGTHGAPTTIFVLRRAGNEASAQTLLSARVLPPLDSVAAGVARFAALLEEGAEPRPLARALGATLLDPALAALTPRVSRIVIVPDGPLHRLPFDALRLADGRYAVERYALSVVPSATVLSELWRRRPREVAPEGGVRVLAIGDPSFPREVTGDDAARSGAARSVYRSAFDSAGGLPRLVASGDEVREVARFAPHAMVRLREEASEAYVKHTPLSGFRVLHFATHALVDEQSVARTAIALAPGHGEDGFLTPGDLAALRLDADLVVLSACRTAGGVVVTGEGVQGLTAPLLQAGARSVVATGWRIGDRAAVSLVDAFYRGLAAGLPMSAALRAAKLDAIRRGAPPSEWAAFGVVGDPLVTVPLQAPTQGPRPLWLALAATALVAGALTAALGSRPSALGKLRRSALGRVSPAGRRVRPAPDAGVQLPPDVKLPGSLPPSQAAEASTSTPQQ